MKNYNLGLKILTEDRTLSGKVTRALREKILSGELAGGLQLKQEELAAAFQVSMSALREALKTLEAEGLVRFYPNRGAAVSELSADEAREIFDIRLFLELGALELAIPQLSEHTLDEAEAVLAETDAETHSEYWGELNWQFHAILYRSAGRPKLLSMIQNLHNNVERYMRLYLSTLHYQAKSQQEHRELLAACRRKDISGAQEILRRHMADASGNLTGYLRQNQNQEGN